MSEPKLISPLLDGFSLGNPISSHDGVACCPAIKENSDIKYIVKIITIPATQKQMDALLLAGAYRDAGDAMEYYRVIGEEVMQEAELLSSLSKLDGFLPYDGWQMEPITKHRLGYEVYLVSSYKRTLEKYVRRNSMTHLEAINLALDMCSALAVCRQAGSLYVDLKPNNIFMSDRKEYRIGDLGFVSLDALNYTTLPDKYRSDYTPPELLDPMASLNLTADTYALGMILYQLYNEGRLPRKDLPEDETFPTPVNADYELAEIIMKAIHPDPEQRWADPQELGRALVGYMQRNVVNDVPITPHIPLEALMHSPSVQEADTEIETPPPPPAEEEPGSPEPPEEFLSEEPDSPTLLPHELSDELSRIMAKADDLLEHEIPEEYKATEVPAGDPFDFVAVNPEDVDDSDVPVDPLMEDTEPRKKPWHFPKSVLSSQGKHAVKRILLIALSLILLCGIAIAGFYYYQNEYLQAIDTLTISGEQNEISVRVMTKVDENLLTVRCTDTYGNQYTAPLENGKAVFKDLLPNTMYRIDLTISGFHGLKGQTSNVFTTEASTDILTFSAVTASEDGSVLLNFTADGEEPERWTMVYTAEGEEPGRKIFDGHTVTITGLSIGKVYTFSLEADSNITLGGISSISYVPSKLILAQNLAVDSVDGTEIHVTWNAPGDILVDYWTVRCYNSSYEHQLTVTEPEAYFADLDPSLSYTVEVTAESMTQPARISISQDPILVSNFHVDASTTGKLKLKWLNTGSLPEGGWLLMYSIDGGHANKSVVKCEKNSGEITPVIPGATYTFSLQAADSTTVYGSTFEYTTEQAPDYAGNGIQRANLTGCLVVTPATSEWRFEDLPNDLVSDRFSVGQKLSVVLHAETSINMQYTNLNVLYVIRDSEGHVLSELTGSSKEVWKDLWYPGDKRYAELDIPKLPPYPGTYSVTVLFNNSVVTELPFTLF